MSNLFTVLIAEKQHIDAIQQKNRLFFEPFLGNKELAFCQWNPEGQCLEDAAPGLMDAVGRQKKWRAVILNPYNEELLKARNPFDIVDQSALKALTVPEQQPESEDSLESWESAWKTYYESLTGIKEEMYRSALEYPLQKLSTWLCYEPEDFILNEVEEKKDVHDWAMEQIGRDTMKPSARLEAMERDQYKCELRMKELIRKEFIDGKGLNIAHPTEFQCISIRTAESSFFDPDSFWNVRSENEYSLFAERNMYFDKMRFMVFDLFPTTHRDYRTDYIRFLVSVLIFASNQAPSSAIQPRRLYQLEVKTDDTPLWTLVTSYDRKLVATTEVIQNEMDKIRSEIPGNLTDKDVERILAAPKDVTVVLDESCNPEKIYVDKDYGLSCDCPENEFHKWNRSYDISKNALSYIVKQQSRAVRKSVGQAQLSSTMLDVDVSRLTQLQIEDIREYTNNLENEMVECLPPDITDMSKYTERLEDYSKEVKKVIKRRMTKQTTLILGAAMVGVYLLCYLPFIILNGGSSKMLTTAISVAGIMIGLLAIIMFVTLFCLRMSIRNAIRNYNDTAKNIMNEILTSLQKFSKYLSASCNVRRGYAIQRYANKQLDEYTMSLRIRQKHLEDLRKKRAYLLEEYRDYFGDKTYCDETMARPYEYDFNQRVEYEYPAPYLAGDTRQMEFMSSGNHVTVPSSYIKSIFVRMEEIYEK